ncbi:putative zinc binding dehydrogenase [Fistulina hepatica ATCC 64428]|uniref:Putative zinc binding dehydrogenase n=1 Tax=Fistulina hepatica ATCC 64428 TaxID=1128425 RepID=A0A0D7A2F4_9AGAR|nr:putative zinc binding dehydrogenase [Fistulina hepatica ATCC 64428]
MSTPQNAASNLITPGGAFTVTEAPYSKPGPGEVVIKNAAIAVNPMDWKIQAFGANFPIPKKYPAIIGADVAGEIYEVGEGVTRFKKGDRVIGKANWFLTARPQDGGFQHYTVTNCNIVSHLPASIPSKSGCVLPLALCTAAMGLYPSARLALPLPQPTKPKSANKVVLIWGGSSSTGSAAIQLAVASGVTVVATASSKNHGFVRGLGASAVLDYHDDKIIANLVETIKGAGGQFAGALDAIGEEQTWRACAEVVKALGGGKVVSNLPMAFKDVPEGVEVLPVNDTSTIIHHKESVEGVWSRFVFEALKAGTLKAVPEPIVVGKGLEKVGEAVELCKNGISAGKVVVEI